MPASRVQVLGWGVLPLLALVAVAPMLVHGPSCGHDFSFHLLSWMEAGQQMVHGGMPRWAFTPAWNAGEPRFLFYPPLSWMLGGLLGLLLPWNLVPAAFTWIALCLSGLAMYRLARRFTSDEYALLPAALYLANPYMLFTAFERTAYGELLAAAWFPLLLDAILRPRIRALSIAVPLALLWFSNAPAAVMGSYTLLLLLLLRLVWHGRTDVQRTFAERILPLATPATAGAVLGLALAACYIVPAAYEQRWVQVGMAVIPGMRVQDHFLFHRMGTNSADDLFHDQVVRTASRVALLLLGSIVALAGALLLRRTRPATKQGDAQPEQLYRAETVALLLLALAIGFLLTPPSLPLWKLVPKLAFLQFPWRWTALLGAVLATLAAMALGRVAQPEARSASASPPRASTAKSVGLAATSLLLTALLSVSAWSEFHQRCDPDDTVSARLAQFHSATGTEATDEYTPVGADGDSLKPGDPAFWLLPPSADADAAAPHTSLAAGAPAHLTIDVPAEGELLVLDRRAYPAWRVVLNGHMLPRSSLVPRADGLIAFHVPPGHDDVALQLVRTPDQVAGDAISAAAVLLLAVAAVNTRRRRTLPRAGDSPDAFHSGTLPTVRTIPEEEPFRDA